MALGYRSEYFNINKCAVCGKEMVITYEMAHGAVYMLIKKPGNTKRYCCGWSCFRKLKYEELMKKKKLREEDVAWLRYARFPVPEHLLPKWMRIE